MKKLSILACTALLFVQCNQKDPKFSIENGKIGALTKETKTTSIKTVFNSDSIVNPIHDDAFTGSSKDIEIFEKGGKHLLSLSTNSDETIDIVTIHDERYTTKEGLGLQHTFGDYKKAYKVTAINRMLNNINIEFEQQDVYITIDVKELPGEYLFDFNTKIESASIPDTAKIKSLQLDWIR